MSDAYDTIETHVMRASQRFGDNESTVPTIAPPNTCCQEVCPREVMLIFISTSEYEARSSYRSFGPHTQRAGGSA